MKVLGISEIDNDAGAVLFLDGELVGAVNEERFSRRKLHAGFPRRSVEWLLGSAGLRSRELDLVVVVKPEPEAELRALAEPLGAHDWWAAPGPIGRRALDWLIHRGLRPPRRRLELGRLQRQVLDWVQDSGLAPRQVLRADHHRSHAAAAFFASGFDRALAVTSDGQGGGVTASAWRCSGASMERLHAVQVPHSMGFFYAMVTRALGFRPARHEGKVTGLAAYQPADAEALALLRELAFAVPGSFETPGVYGALLEVRGLVRRHGRSPVAAAAQQVLEEVLTSYVEHYLQASGESTVVLAGGVFANVKLNQRIHETAGVERLFVFPHMGDGGLGFGAVADLLAEREGRKSRALADVYLGPEYGEAEMEAALLRAGVDHRLVPDIERQAARELACGRTVARFAGRMEFGPRALGNRSILHPATDPSVNQWLNRRLSRSEFMPFAPVVAAADASALFRGYAGVERACEFMTVTLDCTAALSEQAPAVVHVDGTARPQVLREETNPSYYAILDGYRRETGLEALINTSFNIHEEPIVESPADAVRAFLSSGLDVLAMGPFLCRRRS